MQDKNKPKMLTPGEVAAEFRVDPKTVGRWAKEGRISSIRTPGGHRRYPADEVEAMLKANLEQRTSARDKIVDYIKADQQS
jgi:excisionase family DNA binding protein